MPAPSPRLAGSLADEAAVSKLSVRDEIDRSVIVVPGSELFEPGGTTLRPDAAPLVQAIAAALRISVRTVESHRRTVLRKLEVSSAAQLARAVARIELP